jgi:hypothetical protein
VTQGDHGCRRVGIEHHGRHAHSSLCLLTAVVEGAAEEHRPARGHTQAAEGVHTVARRQREVEAAWYRHHEQHMLQELHKPWHARQGRSVQRLQQRTALSCELLWPREGSRGHGWAWRLGAH